MGKWAERAVQLANKWLFCEGLLQMCFKWFLEWKMLGTREIDRQRQGNALGFIGLFCTHLTLLD